MAMMIRLRRRMVLVFGTCLAWLMAILGFTISGCSSSLDDTVMPAYGVPYSSSSQVSSSSAAASAQAVRPDTK